MLVTGPTHAPFLGTFALDPIPDWEREIDEPTYLRRPRRLALIEPGEQEEDEETPGVSAVHWAPIRSRWTTEPPTFEGLYFVRASGSTRTIVQVDRGTDGYLYFSWSDLDPRRVPPASPELEWSTRPIAEPLEAIA